MDVHGESAVYGSRINNLNKQSFYSKQLYQRLMVGQ
jgi:hypothetical protein